MKINHFIRKLRKFFTVKLAIGWGRRMGKDVGELEELSGNV
jgi:hypothetical protein